ncbi:MAG: YciI family protein [Bauldia sp.]|nr:YciI family protein [Bauldia sp.]
MRFAVLVKADERTEAGELPSEQELRDMGNFNDELVKAGIMLAGEGLTDSSKGVRIRYEGGRKSVIDGPFAEAKELVAGFWILEAKSKEEVIEWMKRAPFQSGEIEIRPIFEADDFGENLTPELRAQEDRQRETMKARQEAAKG